MKRISCLIGRHLKGDANPILSLPTLGGTIHLERTAATLTAYGGLVAYRAFVKKLGWLDDRAARFPGLRSSPNALPVADVLRGFELHCLCEGHRFAHVRAVQNDPAVAQVMGMQRVPGEDAFPRLIQSLPRAQARQWVAPTERELYAALPRELGADWDSTVNGRYGHPEDAAVGDNPFKPGRRSHHPLLCIAAGTRLCLHRSWRAGDAVSAAGWTETMDTLWDGQPTSGLEWVAETTVKRPGWSRARRVVFVRTTTPVNAGPQDEFWAMPEEDVQAFVTNLSAAEATAEQVVRLARKRGDAENVFDELKNQWGGRGFCRRRGVVTETAARLRLLTYNLWRVFVSVLLGQSHREAITTRREFLLMAGQLTQSGRQKKLNLAGTPSWWERLRAGDERRSAWLKRTAPQLDLQGDLSRYWSPHPRFSPSDWFKTLTPNCGK